MSPRPDVQELQQVLRQHDDEFGDLQRAARVLAPFVVRERARIALAG